MSDTNTNPTDPKKLSDDELEGIAGGYWSGDRESGTRGFGQEAPFERKR